jgi:transposase InsO family protein
MADFIVELPESQGYNVILVAADHHTKRAHFVPSVSAVSAEGTACLFQDHVWKHHGWAQKIIMDRGTQFMAKFTRALNQLLGMETALSMAYHPQTDGQTEWLNQELEQYLWLYVNHMQTDWADWLPIAEFAYNNREHLATGFSPFFLE